MALTPKQQRFVDEYLIDLNATQAAIRAGYSKKTADQQASRLLTNVKVRAELAKSMTAREERTAVTQDYVLSGIVEVIERCRQVSPVLDRSGGQVFVETPDGDLVPAFGFDAKNVLKGFELLGKHLKLFTEKHEVSGPGGGPIKTMTTDLGKLTDEQLEQLEHLAAAARPDID
jgi:phage terminase small subunit